MIIASIIFLVVAIPLFGFPQKLSSATAQVQARVGSLRTDPEDDPNQPVEEEEYSMWKSVKVSSSRFYNTFLTFTNQLF